MRKFPNSSVLTLITKDNKNGDQQILFIHIKPVPDFYPGGQLFWYPKAGKKGAAQYVWSKLKIRQWFACGTDTAIQQVYDHILTTKSCVIDGQLVNLVLPRFSKNTYQPDPSFDHSQDESETLTCDEADYFPQPFLQKENLQILSGYRLSDHKIKSLFPAGLFAENFLYEKLKKGVFGVREQRKPYLTFHGTRTGDKKDNELTGMAGFYQENFVSGSSYSTRYHNKEGVEIGTATINTANGLFHAPINDPSGKGSIKILVNDLFVKRQDYVLMKDVKFNVNAAEKTYKDIYNRSHMITAKDKTRPATIDSFTWQKDVYQDIRMLI